MSRVMELLEVLRGRKPLFIQTHNFPDHDAVASAFALQSLLVSQGITSELIYDGEIQRDSLKEMIAELGIPIRPQALLARVESDAIVVVDGCKGNQNVTDLVGTEIAVIDHHQVNAPEDVPFVDVRPGVGACSTILHSYFLELGHEVPRKVATALLIGLNTDTAQLTRGVSEADVTAFAHLYRLADIPLHNSILRNYIQSKDLSFFRFALDHVSIEAGVAFCYFPDGCNQNLLGILSDFFLAVQEINFVVLCAHNAGGINFSVRSERPGANAAAVIQEVLRGIGLGGGHRDMAGGLIKDAALFDSETIRTLFVRAVAPLPTH